MSSSKYIIISMGSYEFCSGPMPFYFHAQWGNGLFFDVPVFVTFLDAEDGGVKFTVKLEGGGEFGVSGGG
jgi:hypothetical protein